MNRHFADKEPANSSRASAQQNRTSAPQGSTGENKAQEPHITEPITGVSSKSDSNQTLSPLEQIEASDDSNSRENSNYSSSPDSGSESGSDSGSESGSESGTLQPAPPRPKFVPKSKRLAPDSNQADEKFTSSINWNATDSTSVEPHQVDDTDGLNVEQEYQDWLKRDAARQARDAARLQEVEQEYEDRMERMELAAKCARERV